MRPYATLNNMSEDRNVSTGAAARALDVTRTTLLRWMHQGLVQPASTTAGGHQRWNVADLRRQLRQSPATGETVTDSAKPEPQPVVAAIVTADKRVLVGRRNDGKPPWTFIAGEIEPGESPADAAVREVKEETGLLVKAGHVIGRRVHPKTGRTMIYMAALPTHGDDIFVGDEDELAEVRWADLEEADQLLPGMFEPVHTYLTRIIG
jgi:8-oxo-dGTP pyrophosphatase MutT (NUDIX family)